MSTARPGAARPPAAPPILSVESYSAALFRKVAAGQLDVDRAGAVLWSFLAKLEAVGDRQDLATPLRALRDAITRVHADPAEPLAVREHVCETLFRLYDGVEAGCRGRPAVRQLSGGGGVAPDAIAEELRTRVYKLVVGETWEPYPDLKMYAPGRRGRPPRDPRLPSGTPDH